MTILAAKKLPNVLKRLSLRGYLYFYPIFKKIVLSVNFSRFKFTQKWLCLFVWWLCENRNDFWNLVTFNRLDFDRIFATKKFFLFFFRCYCGTKGWWKSVWSMRVIKLQRQLFSGAPPTFVLGLAPIITEARKNAWFSRVSYSLCTVLLCFFLTHWPNKFWNIPGFYLLKIYLFVCSIRGLGTFRSPSHFCFRVGPHN